jgi:serine/threonine protein kinase
MEIKIANRYALKKTIGQGGFGDVYKTEDSKTGHIRAIKLERRAAGDLIFFESRMLQQLKDIPGLPRVHDFGFEGDFNYMVMDYCGYSLSSLLDICGGKFSLKTVCCLAIKLITVLESVHNNCVLHRDIKPENFLFDPSTKKFYLIDFGLSKKYIDRSGKHMARQENKSFRGTLRYCSLNMHLGVENTRRDDLESFLYVMIYLLKGSLPWQNIKVI